MNSLERAGFIFVGDVPTSRLEEVANTAVKFDPKVKEYVARARPRGGILFLVPSNEEKFQSWSMESAGDYDGFTMSSGSGTPWIVLSPNLWVDAPEPNWRDAVIVHEMVHAYTDPPRSVEPWVLEGFAEMAMQDLTGDWWPPTEFPQKALLPTHEQFSGDGEAAYFLAGDFYVYLSEVHGMEKVNSFHTKALSVSPESVFKEVFDVTLDEAVKAWQKDYAERLPQMEQDSAA
ncbi:hypothetical protein IEE94_14730 [Yimella sp. cx-573]|nr:hypothetical protein [Yimella sp. cx-573]